MPYENEPLDLQGQDRRQAEETERTALALQLEINSLKWLMSDSRGRLFVSLLLAQAGVYRLSFNTDPLVMAFNEGARNAGLRLLSQINTHCPAQYNLLLKETQHDQ